MTLLPLLWAADSKLGGCFLEQQDLLLQLMVRFGLVEPPVEPPWSLLVQSPLGAPASS